MGLFSPRIERRERIEPTFGSRVQTRASDPSWAALAAGGYSLPGEYASPALAQSLAAVSGCVELIAGAISALPAAIIGPDGSPAPAGMSLAIAIQRPNDRQGWPSFVRGLVGDMLLSGNGLVHVTTDGRGGVASLVHVPWSAVSPQIVTGPNGARRVYDVQAATPQIALLGLPRRLLNSDVLHLMQRSDDGGVTGRSVLSRAGGVISRARSADDTAGQMHREGYSGQVYMTADGKIDGDTVDRLKSQFAQGFGGAHNAGRVAVLGSGLRLETLTLKAEDLQLLQTRQFSVEEIARLFGVPLPLLAASERIPADMSSYISTFATVALSPIIAEIESQFAQLLPRGYRLSIDLSGLLRGAFSSQAAALAVLVQSRILSPNDARSELDFGPHADGDALAAGAPPSWPADGAGLPALSPKPGPTGDGGLPNVGSNENGGSA